MSPKSPTIEIHNRKSNLKTIQSVQDEEDIHLKIEELENKVFTLESENKALKKNLEVMQNELVKARE
jgi:chaperonin cofactor prefoldin